ncbi:MAG: putative 2OG-Fe(II) oxygenase [Gammaproteobacteria bacterium]
MTSERISRPDPDISSFFAVPIARAVMADHESLCDELEALFLQKEKAGEVYRHQKYIDTMHGNLFESRFDLFRWPDPPVRALTAWVHGKVASLVQDLNRYDDATMDTLRFDYHAWFHITRRLGYQGQHNHPNASWSGIFCVHPGDSLPDRPDSGLVRFHDPRTHVDMYSDAGNRDLRLPFSTGTCDWKHRRGQLVLFPSYLRHEIYPYLGERPRIVVAFNCWINRIGQQPHAVPQPRG